MNHKLYEFNLRKKSAATRQKISRALKGKKRGLGRTKKKLSRRLDKVKGGLKVDKAVAQGLAGSALKKVGLKKAGNRVNSARNKTIRSIAKDTQNPLSGKSRRKTAGTIQSLKKWEKADKALTRLRRKGREGKK
jgi:hypothetical protein